MDELTRYRTYNHGFTLLEILLALAIFSMLTVMMNQLSHGVIMSSQRVENKNARIAKLQLGLKMLERDISQAMIRKPLVPDQPIDTDFLVAKHHTDKLELIRRNYTNPNAIQARSTLERVKYQVDNGYLQRINTQVKDNDFVQANTITLLENVQQFSLRFWFMGQWHDNWLTPTQLPEAIEVIIATKDYGEIRRIFMLGNYHNETA